MTTKMLAAAGECSLQCEDQTAINKEMTTRTCVTTGVRASQLTVASYFVLKVNYVTRQWYVSHFITDARHYQQESGS
jgi:hypothetical protein